MLPAFLEHHVPPTAKSSVARLWSYTLQTFSFRQTTRSGSDSNNGPQQWAGYKQKIVSESQQNFAMYGTPSKKDIQRSNGIVVQTNVDVESEVKGYPHHTAVNPGPVHDNR